MGACGHLHITYVYPIDPQVGETEASAGEKMMFMLHAVDATGHYILII